MNPTITASNGTTEDPSIINVAEVGFTPTSLCDIKFRAVLVDNNGVSTGSTNFRMHDDAAAAPGGIAVDGGTESFERTLAHEIGHCFGVSHPTQAPICGIGTCDANSIAQVGQIMTTRTCGSTSGVRKRTDIAHPDDIRGLHTSVLGGNYSMPRRQISLARFHHTRRPASKGGSHDRPRVARRSW
jgi:hypothetical protein